MNPLDPDPSRTSLDVCVRCRPAGWKGLDSQRPGAELARTLDAEVLRRGGPSVRRREIVCLSQCLRPCVVAFSGEGRFTYLFGDIEPTRDADAVLDAFLLFRARTDGFVERAERPPALRSRILGRVPPLGWQGPTVSGESGAAVCPYPTVKPTVAIQLEDQGKCQ